MIYLPQLDSTRAIAVFLVLLNHWIPKNHWINTFNNGLIGVIFFYVLSGFLITTILIRNKNESSSISTSYKIKTFYIRRLLRIFPIYYLTIIILWLVDFQDVRSHIFYFLTYTQNFLFVFEDNNYGYLIHFWSLANEEQFYLFWPFLVFLLRPKFLLSFAIALIVLSVGFRINIDQLIRLNGPSNYLIIGCLDSFLLGALLSIFLLNKTLEQIKTYASLLILIGLSILLFYFRLVDNIFIISMISVSLLFYFIHSKNRIFNVIFKNGILVYIGKISYSIYIFHYFVYPLNHWLHLFSLKHNLTIPFTESVLFPEFNNIYIRFVYFSVITFVLASISWYILEKPINSLKSKFEYKGI
ncbi:MAG: acyltransferase [Bacteroidetes bacterium]|nr:acyltransferase [Bacteroidota bacterium]